MRKPCCNEREGGKLVINKGAWSKQEDQKLIDYIKTHGEGCWRSIPKEAGLQRCGKSCRLRWINYLRPDLKRGNFAPDEEDLIIKLHSLLGNRWSLIAGRLPGRTDNEVKNYWNSHIKKKLIQMGIDPNKHKPQKQQRFIPSAASTTTTSSHPPSQKEAAEMIISTDSSSIDNPNIVVKTEDDDMMMISTRAATSVSAKDDDAEVDLDLSICVPATNYSEQLTQRKRSKLIIPKTEENIDNDKLGSADGSSSSSSSIHEQYFHQHYQCSSELACYNLEVEPHPSPTLLLFR